MYKLFNIVFITAFLALMSFSAACDSEFVKQEDCREFCEKSLDCSSPDFTEALFDTCWSYCEELDKKWDGLSNVSFNRADFACVKYEDCAEFNACVKDNVGYDGTDGDTDSEAGE